MGKVYSDIAVSLDGFAAGELGLVGCAKLAER